MCKQFIDAALEILRNPTCRYTAIAGCFRFFGGYAIGFYMPLYFVGIYPDYSTQYSYLNAIAISVFGFISVLTGGIVSDRLEEKGYYLTKGLVCVFCSAMGIPTIILCT